MAAITTLNDEARIAFDNIVDIVGDLGSPSLRLGVTGLSRSGKTIFITALVHNFLHGGRLPLFEPYASGRIAQAALRPQPSLDVPRFQYEEHVQSLVGQRDWPNSTRAISELRLTIRYESASLWNRALGSGTLNIDIVDYPGEWLLDLPLLGQSFSQWSEKALQLARSGKRAELSNDWLAAVEAAVPESEAVEADARSLSALFTDYLRRCREDDHALSTLPPGRFLMPGDLEGSPALTFSPLAIAGESKPERGSLHAMMQERYDAYRQVVVKPFFRNHFARLDRQIVLVDMLHAINAGSEAIADLEAALADILQCFRPGRSSWLMPIIGRRVNKIMFAATKADHLHHETHGRLEALLRRLVEKAVGRAQFAGAQVEVTALAAIRATREGSVEQNGDTLPVVIGTPIAGEHIDGVKFNGKSETAVFPGDLPANPDALLAPKPDVTPSPMKFVRFRPPMLEKTEDGISLSLPHIRLDRALQFLLADRLE